MLDVLAEEGYIRGYARVDYDGGKSEFEIELKYFDGEPVIKEIKRVSTPGRRVYSSVKDLPTVANGLGRRHTFDAEGRHVGCARADRECRRRNSMQHVLGASVRSEG